jgi:hypothetical protein
MKWRVRTRPQAPDGGVTDVENVLAVTASRFKPFTRAGALSGFARIPLQLKPN